MLGSDIATNRATLRWVAVIGRCEGHHHDLSGNVGEYQPVCWRDRWVEQRIRVPDLVDGVDAERVMFEEMGGLPVDLEWIGVVQLIEIEQVTRALNCITNEYGSRESARLERAAGLSPLRSTVLRRSSPRLPTCRETVRDIYTSDRLPPLRLCDRKPAMVDALSTAGSRTGVRPCPRRRYRVPRPWADVGWSHR